MKRKRRIENILFNNFKSWIIEVKDISNLHKGHNNFAGDNETHFSIVLNPNTKKRIPSLEIHRKINSILKSEFSSGMHALEIKIKY
jgi:BolA protein